MWNNHHKTRGTLNVFFVFFLISFNTDTQSKKNYGFRQMATLHKTFHEKKNKKRKTLMSSFVGVDGFEPPTLCL